MEDRLALIESALRLFHGDGGPRDRINLRCKYDTHTSNVFFLSIEECAQRALRIDESLTPRAMWTNLNPIKPEVNFIQGHGATNGDISCIRWLPVDVDPIRGGRSEAGETSDMPATWGEVSEARRVADRVRSFINGQLLAARTALSSDRSDANVQLPFRQPAPITAFGGNSWHLLYPIQPLAPDSTIVAGILRGLDRAFSDDKAVVDKSCGNAGRVWKLYGTFSRKGAQSTLRPYRMAAIESRGTPDRLLTLDELQHLLSALGEHEDPPRKMGTGIAKTAAELRAVIDMVELNLAAFANNIKFRGDWRAPDGTPALRYEFECPFFHDGHGAPGKRPAYCVIFRDGTFMAGCHGGRCAGRGWSDMTDRFLEGSHGNR